MRNMIMQVMAEEATGICQSGALKPWLSSQQDKPVSWRKAGKAVHDEEVHVPAAGAGSYAEVADLLGLGNATLWESTSSAGDWVIRLEDQEGCFMSQRNRFPRHGFAYQVYKDIEWYDQEEAV
jgi:hypothetical protein